MRVLVCGGRDFKDATWLCKAMDYLYHDKGPFHAVVHGGARGADHEAGSWARARDIPEIVFRADWDKHGKAAGPLRNQRMLDEGKPDIVIAFPGGPGTADMVRRARDAGLPVTMVG